MIYFNTETKNWYIKDGNKENLSGGGTWYALLLFMKFFTNFFLIIQIK